MFNAQPSYRLMVDSAEPLMRDRTMEDTRTHQIAAWREFLNRAKRAMSRQEYGKAEEYLLQAYEHAKSIYGHDHGEVGLVLLQLVEVCEKQNKLELAAKYFAETEEIASLYRADAE